VSSTLKSCLKRDVVTIAEGRNLGQPTDIFIDPEEHAASLVVLARGNVPDSTLFVAASAVRSFDTDTLAIDSLDSLQIAATNDEALSLLERALDFRGRPLIDSQGRKLGKIVKVRLDERGKVVEYVARRGLLGWVKPRNHIDPRQLGTAGGEMAVVQGIEEPHPPLSLPEGNAALDQATDE